jgi:excisionase family DNA binding protein
MSKPLTSQQLANLFKVSLQTIHNWANKGMPHTKTPGRQLRFDPTEVRAYCERHGYDTPPALLALVEVQP